MPRARSARSAAGDAGTLASPPTPAGDTDQLAAELTRLRSQLDQVTSQLEHTERLATLGTIAGLIAHEFNNILTPVMSYAQMALADGSDAELARKALTRALTGSERASKIASAILDFARDEGPTPTTRTPSRVFHVEHPPEGESTCLVSQVVADTMECLGRHPSKDGITLELNIPADLRVAIRPVALQHVLLNLVLNSRNAMIPGGGTLTISASAGGGGDVLITVADTGKGMTPEQLDSLFTPFVAGRRGVSSAERKSTGLGMTICKRLVEDARGSLHVESWIGQGTSVTVRLARYT